MALTIYEDKGATPSKVKVDRRLYVDAAGQLVEDGDPDATSLFCSAGKFVNRADFMAAGGKIAETPAAETEVAAPPAAKAAKTSKKGN